MQVRGRLEAELLLAKEKVSAERPLGIRRGLLQHRLDQLEEKLEANRAKAKAAEEEAERFRGYVQTQ